MRTIVTGYMRELPVGYKVQMRELSLGPVAWGMWSWTFHDGSTRAAVAIDGSGQVIAWSALSTEVDKLPVVGVFVPEEYRRAGLARRLVQTVLLEGIAANLLEPGAAVFASVWRWSKYPEVIASCGLVCTPWV